LQKPPLSGISPISFFGSAVISLGLILFATVAPATASRVFETANKWIVEEAGWLYMLAVAGFVIFLLCLAISPLGKIKLGPDDSSPDYSYGTWVAMLFSAGMGIGIVFFGVAEPITHFSTPPDAPARTPQAARDAMEITFFHWGIHAWAIYAVIGLSLAYFGYRRGEPLVIRSAFRPLLGDRVNGPIGDMIDIFAVVGTLAGLATSLGLGVAQLNATGAYLFGLEQNITTQVVLIGIVTILATITVATGLDNGIRRLSEMILIVSFILMGLILAVGPTRFLLQAFVENIGLYLNGFVSRTFHIYAYEPTDWVGTWTLFYWGWWISWSPFVGMFIARISRGRTIRELTFGVLLIPLGFTLAWLSIFGNTAIDLVLNHGAQALSATAQTDPPMTLFKLLEYLPLPRYVATATLLIGFVLFLTPVNSGTLMIANLSCHGQADSVDAPVWLRIFWAVVTTVVSCGLLMAGNFDAMQTAVVLCGLPFSVILILYMLSLRKVLRDEPVRI
jgi:choline/glycine/proline betaine transport protein